MTSRLDSLDLPEDVKRIVRSMGIDDLYEVQATALRHALAGEDLVVSIPTASGKSLVAYLALLKAAMQGRKGLYIVPLRALASEKYDDLQAFEPLGIKVGISTGDYDSSDAWLTKYDIVIATSEKTDALMRQRSPMIPEIKVVVADEVHMMNDPKRGPTVEVLLARFKEMESQIIALSATISNARQIAEWLDAKCIYDEWRPVPLREGVYADGTIQFSDGGFRSLPKKADPVCSLVADTLADGGQALVFVRTRKVSEAQAKALRDVVASTLGKDEGEALKEIAERIRRSGEESTSLAHDLASCVESGVSFHHAGLRDTHRKEIERAFRARMIRAVVSTTTLAAGVNLPARRVILRDLNRFSSEEGGSVPLPVFEVKQMCGRAGRPKYDKCGESILVAKGKDEVESLIETYLHGESEAIESRLAAEPALRAHVLARIASASGGLDADGIKTFLGSTFYAYTGKESLIKRNLTKVMKYLQKAGFIEADDGVYKSSRLGRLTSDLYLDPVTAERFVKGLQNAKDEHSDEAYLHLVSGAIEMPTLYPRRAMQEEIYREAMMRDWMIPPPTREDELDFYLAEIWTAKMLSWWMEEKSEESIMQVFNVGPGDIASRSEIAEWLLYSCSKLCEAISTEPSTRSRIRDLSIRVSYGISEELLSLVRLPGIGRVRARALYGSGIRLLDDVIEASEERLASVPGIGEKLAERIKKAALDAYRG